MQGFVTLIRRQPDDIRAATLLTVFPSTLASARSPFTRKLTEVMVASHPIRALDSFAILTSSGPGNTRNAGINPWLDSDVLFLEIAVLQGMSLTQIAGFLGREENEVRGKAKELEVLRGLRPAVWH